MKSAKRNVADPIVYSQADTYAVSKYSVKRGKRMTDPTKKVPPPTK